MSHNPATMETPKQERHLPPEAFELVRAHSSSSSLSIATDEENKKPPSPPLVSKESHRLMMVTMQTTAEDNPTNGHPKVTAEDIKSERTSRISYENSSRAGVKKLLSKCGGCKMIDADPAFASLFVNPERACEYAHYEPFLKAKADWVVLKRSNPGYAKTNADIRHELYVLFTFLKHGYKGQNSRVPIPTCVEAKIKNAYPPKNGHYTFFNLEREMKKSKAIAAEKRAFKQKLADIKTAAQQKKAMLKATAEQMAMEARDAIPSKEDGEHQKSPSFDLKAAAKEAFHDMKDAYDYNGGSDDSSCDFFDDY